MTHSTSNTPQTKKCPACKRKKSLDLFSASKNRKDGHDGQCKECRKKYRQANRDRMISAATKWNLENPGKASASIRKWQKNNREKVNAKRRVSRRAYYKSNRREILDKRKQKYQQAHPSKERNNDIATLREKKRVIKLLYRARRDGLPDTFTSQQWRACLVHFNECCAACGRPLNGLFHKAHADHWIPLSSPACPGSIVSNIVCLCGGLDGCNQSKGDKDPIQWLIRKFGHEQGNQINAKVQAYFDSLT